MIVPCPDCQGMSKDCTYCRGDGVVDMHDGDWRALEPDELRAWRDVMATQSSPRCVIDGCPFTDIDLRGPITFNGVKGYVCTTHWEAILLPIGEHASMVINDRNAREEALKMWPVDDMQEFGESKVGQPVDRRELRDLGADYARRMFGDRSLTPEDECRIGELLSRGIDPMSMGTTGDD